MLNSKKKSLVLYVLRLGRFVSSMPSCLESALRRCELHHSVTLKAELRRSIEIVLGGSHFVAELSTGFEKSLVYQQLPFAFDDRIGILVMVLFKKKTQALSLRPFLPLYKAIEYICSFLSCKKKRTERIFQQRKRQTYARFGINLFACILFPPSRCERRSLHSAKGIYCNPGNFRKRLIFVLFVSSWSL